MDVVDVDDVVVPGSAVVVIGQLQFGFGVVDVDDVLVVVVDVVPETTPDAI